MKKVILIVFALFFLAGCDEILVEELAVPKNLVIEESILNFDIVDGAVGYRIEVINEETNISKKYLVEHLQDLSLLNFQPGLYLIKIQARGDGNKTLDSKFSEGVKYMIGDTSFITEIEKGLLTDPTLVKMFGRYNYSELDKNMHFYFTASGFEVKFYGTELLITLTTGTNPAGKEPHLVGFLDGEENPYEGTLYVLDENEFTIRVANLEEGVHTFKLLKRSESIDSKTTLKKLVTDGNFLEVDPYKVRRIEIIAASSSAGYGNLVNNTNDEKTTQNSNGLVSFASLAAYYLDSEVNIFSASGWPLLKGPWTGSSNIPGKYDYVDVNSGLKWRHSDYVPDVFVVNLGTNDWSYIKDLTGTTKETAINDFIASYIAFIEKLYDLNNDATIIIAYGLMNESNIFEPTVEVYNQLKENNPEIDLHIIKLPGANSADGIGSSSHPGIKTHLKAGLQLAELIGQVRGWDLKKEPLE